MFIVIFFMFSMFNVSYQLQPFSLSVATSLFTLSQKIKPNTSPTHQIIQLSIPVRRRRDETESKCTFLKVIICLCHRYDGTACIKMTYCNIHLAISGVELLTTLGFAINRAGMPKLAHNKVHFWPLEEKKRKEKDIGILRIQKLLLDSGSARFRVCCRSDTRLHIQIHIVVFNFVSWPKRHPCTQQTG